MPNRPESLSQKGSEKMQFRYPLLLPILKKTRFSAVWDATIPDFSAPKDDSNPHSGHRPRIDDCNLASGEILHIARGQRRPS